MFLLLLNLAFKFILVTVSFQESLNKRLNFVSDKGLCFSCLRLSHGNSKCPIRAAPRLPYRKKGHHALLCSCSEDAKSSSLKPPDDKQEEQPSKKVSIGVNQVSGKGVRLHVLPVVVSNECGDEKEVYAMFDNGSEESLRFLKIWLTFWV